MWSGANIQNISVMVSMFSKHYADKEDAVGEFEASIQTEPLDKYH